MHDRSSNGIEACMNVRDGDFSCEEDVGGGTWKKLKSTIMKICFRFLID